VQLADLGVAELLDVFGRREASPEEALGATLARIDRLDRHVGAVLSLCWEQALERARDSTQRWLQGTARPLEGVPYGLKDIVETAGIRTTGGSQLYADHVPTVDAAVERRLRDAGGVLVAKLQTFEFAAGANAVTSNPWDLDRNAAGSSSGSGAAVAARELPLTIGTDTGGSVAIPASFVGIAGLKATFGRIPRSGVFPLSWTLDHVGPMTRSSRDIALALGVLAGHDPDDPTSSDAPVPDYVASLDADLTSVRVGVPEDWFFDIIHPGVEAAAQAAIDVLATAGARIVPIRLPSTKLLDLHAMELTIIGAEAASLHTPHLARYAELGTEFQQVLARSQSYSAVDYLNALRARHLVQLDFQAAFDQVDVIIAPGANTVAPRHDHLVAVVGDTERPWVDVVSRTTAVFNLTGIPSLSIPSGFADGLPVGIQVVGPPFGEPIVLAVADAYQQLTDHHTRLPQIVQDDSAQPHGPWDPSERHLPDELPVVTTTLDSTW
jgi:aspartyl-tRNA(Asn)/glutamyl-tRNA(Gln) amidotransferase subunit A